VKELHFLPLLQAQPAGKTFNIIVREMVI